MVVKKSRMLSVYTQVQITDWRLKLCSAAYENHQNVAFLEKTRNFLTGDTPPHMNPFDANCLSRLPEMNPAGYAPDWTISHGDNEQPDQEPPG